MPVKSLTMIMKDLLPWIDSVCIGLQRSMWTSSKGDVALCVLDGYCRCVCLPSWQPSQVESLPGSDFEGLNTTCRSFDHPGLN